MLTLDDFRKEEVKDSSKIKGGDYMTRWCHPDGSSTEVYHFDDGYWEECKD